MTETPDEGKKDNSELRHGVLRSSRKKGKDNHVRIINKREERKGKTMRISGFGVEAESLQVAEEDQGENRLGEKKIREARRYGRAPGLPGRMKRTKGERTIVFPDRKEADPLSHGRDR